MRPLLKTSPPESGSPQTETEYYLLQHLTHLYGAGNALELAQSLLSLVKQKKLPRHTGEPKLSASDVLLITYADTLQAANAKPLEVLKEFADTHLRDYFSGIHVLPFFPFSSDDGFAVVDYKRVREDLGTWQDFERLAENFDLMFDLVINHCSREHIWFADFISGREPGNQFFITLPSDTNVETVVRPRNTPLLSEVQTYAGVQHVWTTFSDDQIDLNFENPQVLYHMVDILFDYIAFGARWIRLDAIAFLWKRLGTTCMSLPETHTVVKILRLLLDESDTGVKLLSETNVPHAENVSYFGRQDEAHLVYQFSLAPLILYSYLFNEGSHLQNWALNLDPPPPGCAYLNFIASHDGVGLRPLEGLVEDREIEELIELIHQRGGFVSMRTTSEGSQKAYELNIALFSAFGGNAEAVPAYLGAHQLLLAFQGVPALYLRALLATPNDLVEVEKTGRTRSINRGHLQQDSIGAELAEPNTIHAQVFTALGRALTIRRAQPAFSPNAHQEVFPCPPQIFAMRRIHAEQEILVLASFTPMSQTAELASLLDCEAIKSLHDLLTDTTHNPASELHLAPYQTLWLELSYR